MRGWLHGGPQLSTTASAATPGFPTGLARSNTAKFYPFGLFLANANTLYVADEGVGKAADATTDPISGLENGAPIFGCGRGNDTHWHGMRILELFRRTRFLKIGRSDNEVPMRESMVWVLLTMLITATSSGAAAVQPVKQESNVSHGINQFGVDVYQKLAAGNANVFFSPASISTALAMAYAGARGQTAGQIAAVMHFDNPPDKLNAEFAQMLRAWNSGRKDYQLAVANAMWGQRGYPFAASFNDLLRRDYGAAIHEVDFAQSEKARQAINQWVEQQTQGKITDLIPSGGVNAMTRLVLANAIYFKGAWDHPFQPAATHSMPFHLSSGQRTPVPMMSQSSSFRYWKGADFAALDMPYAHEQLSMLVFLPDSTDGLPKLESSLTSKKLASWADQLLRQRAREVQVSFPKFKMTQELELSRTMSQMGMPLAFSDLADFSGMNAGSERIWIGDVFHKAYVDVNEEGTEAAAATGLVMRATAMPARQAVFVADHPFFFVIRDNQSGSILFMGRVENPNG